MKSGYQSLKITTPFALVLLAAVPIGAQPRLNAVTPVAVQGGSEVDLSLTGTQLTGPHTLLSDHDGIEVLELTGVDATHVTAKCRIAADAPAGLVGLRLCGDSGISTLRTITITPMAVVAEVEPNDLQHPQTVETPCTIAGTITAEDTDGFQFAAEEGQRISAEVVGLRMGYAFYDPCLELRGPDGQRITFLDDSALTRQDPGFVIDAPATGKYTLLIRDRAYGGNDQSRYALHLGSFARPTLAFPGGGQPGESIDVTFPVDSELPGTSVAIPEDSSRVHRWVFQDEGGPAPTALNLHVSPHPNCVEVEPNQERKNATVVELPAVLCGTIDSAEDRDFFRFAAKKGDVWTFRSVSTSIVRSPIDTILRLYEAAGRYLTANDDVGGPDSYFEYTIPADGDYELQVADHLNRGGPEYVYRIEIDRRQPTLTMALPERIYNVSTTVTVPRGNRMAALVTVARQNFDAAVNLECHNLPGGLSFEAPSIEPGRDRVPVVFRATSEATPGGALIPLRGSATVSDTTLAGNLRQRTKLVLGENNRDMWGHDSHRVAVAINPAAPFQLILDPLPDPLVRSGEKPLTIRVERQEGFTTPVNVQMLYNPPGVSAPGNITIAEGKSENVMNITANRNAAVGSWPIVLIAQTTVDGIRYQVSSEIMQLTITDVFFDLTFHKTSIQQGNKSTLSIDITRREQGQRPAQAELVGLPPGVSAAAAELASDRAQLVFELTAAPNARPGKYNSVLCRIRIDGEQSPIVQTLGTGQLRVDRPRSQS